MRVVFFMIVAGLFAGASLARADPYTIFLLDVSGSMEYRVAGKKRLDLAKDELADALRLGGYPSAELLMWNSEKYREGYGDGAQLAQQVSSATRGHRASYLGSALLSINDAGYRCAHVVFVTDEYPDDQGNFLQAINELLREERQNTVTVYVVKHPQSHFYSTRFSKVFDSARYRVVDGKLQGALGTFLAENPAPDTCGTLS